MPSGRKRGDELITMDLVSAAIGDHGIAARYFAMREIDYARAFAARGPKPCSIFAILEHTGMLAQRALTFDNHLRATARILERQTNG
jgi:hypothetical protein